MLIPQKAQKSSEGYLALCSQGYLASQGYQGYLALCSPIGFFNLTYIYADQDRPFKESIEFVEHFSEDRVSKQLSICSLMYLVNFITKRLALQIQLVFVFVMNFVEAIFNELFNPNRYVFCVNFLRSHFMKKIIN